MTTFQEVMTALRQVRITEHDAEELARFALKLLADQAMERATQKETVSAPQGLPQWFAESAAWFERQAQTDRRPRWLREHMARIGR